MNPFKKVGKKFEETKQTVLGDDETQYICRSCEKPVADASEYCPNCGERAVEQRE